MTGLAINLHDAVASISGAVDGRGSQFLVSGYLDSSAGNEQNFLEDYPSHDGLEFLGSITQIMPFGIAGR